MMVGRLMVMILLFVAVASMTAGILLNRLSPSYDTALAVPLFNAIAIVLAVLGLVVACVVYRRNREYKQARGLLWCAAACVLGLILLFPLSNAGYFSVVG